MISCASRRICGSALNQLCFSHFDCRLMMRKHQSDKINITLARRLTDAMATCIFSMLAANMDQPWFAAVVSLCGREPWGTADVTPSKSRSTESQIANGLSSILATHPSALARLRRTCLLRRECMILTRFRTAWKS
jgi:hypothetical protein